MPLLHCKPFTNINSSLWIIPILEMRKVRLRSPWIICPSGASIPIQPALPVMLLHLVIPLWFFPGQRPKTLISWPLKGLNLPFEKRHPETSSWTNFVLPSEPGVTLTRVTRIFHLCSHHHSHQPGYSALCWTHSNPQWILFGWIQIHSWLRSRCLS